MVTPSRTFRTWGHALGHLEGVNMYEHTIETTNTIKCHELIHLIHLKSGIFQAFWSQCIIWPYSALLAENKGKVINLVALNLHFCEISQCFLSKYVRSLLFSAKLFLWNLLFKSPSCQVKITEPQKCMDFDTETQSQRLRTCQFLWFHVRRKCYR